MHSYGIPDILDLLIQQHRPPQLGQKPENTMYLSVSSSVRGNEIVVSAYHPSDYLPPIALRWDDGASGLYIDDEQASDLLIDLAQLLFDRGTMSNRAAMRVSYLTSIVYNDSHEYEQAAADHAYDEIRDAWVSDEV